MKLTCGKPQGILVLFILLAYLTDHSFSYVHNHQLSWCDVRLCGNLEHIACNNDGKLHSRCPPDAAMVDLRSYRGLILHEHNKRRNFIAAGLLPGYYPAARMATMVWDEELEYVAGLNLKECLPLDHDECHNTYRFRNVGQNLAGVSRDRYPIVNVPDILNQTLGLWFGEYPLIDSNFIRSFKVVGNFEKYGHFAEAVVDRNTHVGCAMMRYTRPDYPEFYIYNVACNYASNYALNLPVYRSGKPASGCKTGSNPNYPALCSIKEEFNPNYDLYGEYE